MILNKASNAVVGMSTKEDNGIGRIIGDALDISNLLLAKTVAKVADAAMVS